MSILKMLSYRWTPNSGERNTTSLPFQRRCVYAYVHNIVGMSTENSEHTVKCIAK